MRIQILYKTPSGVRKHFCYDEDEILKVLWSLSLPDSTLITLFDLDTFNTISCTRKILINAFSHGEIGALFED